MLIYLASPYTSSDKAIEQKRYEKVCSIAAELMRKGLFVFSPISHCHSIACYGSLPGDWNYWKNYCNLMLSKCQKMIVLKMDGWEDSTGIKGEIDTAKLLGIDIEYMEC